MARVSAYSLSQEPDEVMRAYLEFMERAGVHELIMFFDGQPSPGLREMIAAREGGPMRIRTEALDEAYWRAALGDEVNMARKFTHCIGRAHELMTGDWLWVGDPDEFPEEPQAMFAALDRLPAEIDAVSVPPAEATWGPGEADAPPFATRVFRVTTPLGGWGWRLLKRIIYGRWHVFFDRNMLSHKSGKQFVRRGAQVDLIDVHRTRRDGWEINVDLAEAAGLDRVLHVRHYDAVSYERWIAKMRRRVRNGALSQSSRRPGRLAQVELARGLLARMEAAGDEAEARRIGERAFRRLYHLTPLQARLLGLIGGVVRLSPATAPAP
jgi:hypothetical protein